MHTLQLSKERPIRSRSIVVMSKSIRTPGFNDRARIKADGRLLAPATEPVV
ncbi:hypothetical protein BN8_02004 [Fibrisoma limi BUZ 3]|uniref:Uncharacterized protein n=1 Tax=Fibrisoma limi BUZ 3 TaxID=1185876 RepID=I2GGD2_9BACT|nr:hypothetical protein BN8_02004 [Fibrisoma limi BUZ 3]